MKIGEVFLVAYRNVIAGFKYYALTVVAICVAVMTVLFAFGEYYSYFYEVNKIKSIFSTNSVNKIEINYMSSTDEQARKNLNLIENDEGIDFLFYEYTTVAFEEKNSGVEEYSNISNVLFISNELFQCSVITDTLGNAVDLQNQGDYVAAAVGNALADTFPIGTIITDSYSGTKYVVTTILAENACFISSNAVYNIDTSVCLDNYIVAAPDMYYYDEIPYLTLAAKDNIFLLRDENNSVISGKAYEIADEINLDIDVITYNEYLKGYVKENHSAYTLTIILCVILGIALFIMVVVTAVIDIISERHMFGVCMANGVTLRDIHAVLMLKNLSKILLPCCLCIICINKMNYINVYFYSMVTTLVLLVVAMFLYEIIATELAFHIVKRDTLLKMIGEDE